MAPGRSQPPRSGGRLAPVEASAFHGHSRQRAVDDVVEARLEHLQAFLCLRLGDHAILDGLVGGLRRAVEDRLLQPVDRLVLRLRDVGQRLAVRPASAGAAAPTGRGSPPWRRGARARRTASRGARSPRSGVGRRRRAEPRRFWIRAFIASAWAFVMRPAFRSASTWSIAAALVASWSFSVEMPRCPATRARKLSPRVAELFEAAMAPPAPTASARPAVRARTRFESRCFIGFLSSDRTFRFEAAAGRRGPGRR